MTTHGGTPGLSGLLQGPWLEGLQGLSGVGEHDEPCAGPSGCWLVSEPHSQAALASGLEPWEEQQRVSRRGHPWSIPSSESVDGVLT